MFRSRQTCSIREKFSWVFHGLPDRFQIIAQGGILHFSDELQERYVPVPADLQHLREILLRVDLDLFLGDLVLYADGAAADTEDPVLSEELPVLVCLEEHCVGVGEVLFCPVDEDFGAGKAGPLAGKSQRAVKRDKETVRFGIPRAEDLRGVIGADCMGTGWAVADLVDTFDTFHETSPRLASAAINAYSL